MAGLGMAVLGGAGAAAVAVLVTGCVLVCVYVPVGQAVAMNYLPARRRASASR